MKIRAVVSPVCVSGQLPLPRARVISVTGTWQCVVCNAGNVMCNVKWLLDPFNRGPWDQGWAAFCPLIGGVLTALSSDWLIHWPHIRHPGEVRAANTCQQKSALTPLQYNKLRTNEKDLILSILVKGFSPTYISTRNCIGYVCTGTWGWSC